MFDDDVSYSEAIECVLDDERLPYIGQDLRDTGGERSGGTCSECNGVLYDHENEVVCSGCSLVVSAETKEKNDVDLWQQFNNNRPEYFNSRKPRCVGGFPRAHDWVESDDIDGPVSELNAEDFY